MANAKLDQKVKDLMAKVKEKKAKIATLAKPQWQTTCSLQLPGWERLNIQVETDLAVLASAYGELETKKAGIAAAAKAFDKSFEPVWQRYSVEAWQQDIKQRVDILSIKQEQAKLAKMEEQLKLLTSEEQRREMALAELESELAD